MWFIGTNPDAAGVVLNPMEAVDGAFDSLTEDVVVEVRINQSGLVRGETYDISVMARDAAFNWGDWMTTQITIP